MAISQHHEGLDGRPAPPPRAQTQRQPGQPPRGHPPSTRCTLNTNSFARQASPSLNSVAVCMGGSVALAAEACTLQGQAARAAADRWAHGSPALHAWHCRTAQQCQQLSKPEQQRGMVLQQQPPPTCTQRVFHSTPPPPSTASASVTHSRLRRLSRNCARAPAGSGSSAASSGEVVEVAEWVVWHARKGDVAGRSSGALAASGRQPPPAPRRRRQPTGGHPHRGARSRCPCNSLACCATTSNS